MAIAHHHTSINNLFIASGCACKPNVLEWCPSTSLLIFASKNDICIAEGCGDQLPLPANNYRIIQTINAHNDEITCVKVAKLSKKCIQNQLNHVLFCSSSTTGEIAIWQTTTKEANVHSVTNILRETRQSNISLVKLYQFDAEKLTKLLIANTSFNKIEYQYLLTLNDEKIHENTVRMLDFPGRAVLYFEFGELHDLLFLAVGLSDGHINFFHTSSNEPGSFSNWMTLPVESNAWVRSLSFRDIDEGLLLASASDSCIKIWKLGLYDKDNTADLNKLKPQDFRSKNDDLGYSINLESTLFGHDGLIQTVAWHPCKYELLSSGADSTVIRWQCSSDENSVWLPVSRMGEQTGSGDYYDAVFSPGGDCIIYHTLCGALYLWRICGDEVEPMSHTISGHFDCVTDICWDPAGSFLLTTSADKTTRILTSLKNQDIFFEIARPQLHGHPLNCIASISSTKFVSGGEEKIFRVFQANLFFARNMEHLAGFNLGEEDLPSHAYYQTELSLTNIPQSNEEKENECSHTFKGPPREDQLNKLTLFPEIQKLYGHGFEVFTLASNHKGTVIATSCKASQPEHAAIFIWDTETWQHRSTLHAHQLTVTQLAFSKDDNFLLSVSRDRTWTLFEIEKEDDHVPFNYIIYHQSTIKTSKHSRIIWSCAWSHDSMLFATASRDKTLNIWTPAEELGANEENKEIKHILTFTSEDSITSVDFAPMKMNGDLYLLAIGLESGKIFLLGASPSDSECQILNELPRDFAHSSTVTRIRFRPRNRQMDSGNKKIIEFASSSNTVKIFRLLIDQ